MTTPAQAFEAVVKAYRPLLRSIAYRRLRDGKLEFDDFAQEVWAALWATWHDLGDYQAAPAPVISNIANWVVLSHWQRRSAKKRSGVHVPIEDWNGGSVEPTQDYALQLRETAAAIDDLPGMLADTLVSVATGSTMAEHAADEGVSKQAIHQRLTKARNRLIAEGYGV